MQVADKDVAHHRRQNAKLKDVFYASVAEIKEQTTRERRAIPKLQNNRSARLDNRWRPRRAAGKADAHLAFGQKLVWWEKVVAGTSGCWSEVVR